MDFWKMAWDNKYIEEELLRKAVITEQNKYGDITPEQFKEITKEDF